MRRKATSAFFEPLQGGSAPLPAQASMPLQRFGPAALVPPLTNEGMMVESFALRRIRACRPVSAEDERDQPWIGYRNRVGFVLASIRASAASLRSLPSTKERQQDDQKTA